MPNARLLLQALLSLAAARLRPVTWGRPSACGGLSARHAYSPDRIARAVALAARLVPRATCLVKAIAAQSLLRRSGWPAEVWVGVAKDAHSGFQAHAWVESEGRVILGATAGREFTRLLQLG